MGGWSIIIIVFAMIRPDAGWRKSGAAAVFRIS
jgi:hypothetical protein